MKERQSRLLALGWDDRRHEACRRHGIELVSVVSASELDHVNPSQTAPQQTLVVDDHTSVASVLAEIDRAGLLDAEFQAVLTSDEFVVPLAGTLAMLLGVSGTDPRVALGFRDKHLQKQRVRDLGIRTARTAVIADINVDGIPESWEHWPAVLKPIAGGGTGSTARCDDIEQARAFLAARREAGARSFFGQPERKFLLEEYTPGTEWYLNGCMRAGELAAFSAGVYVVSPISIKERRTLRTRELDPDRDAESFALARSFGDTALKGLGLKDGLFHMEAFFDDRDGSLVFGECAARVPGGAMPEAIYAKTGVDLIEMEVLHAVGRTASFGPGAHASETVGLTFLEAAPGVLVGAPDRADIAARPGVVFAGELPPLGAELSEMSSNTTVNLTQAVLAANEPDELGRLMDDLVAWARARTEIVARGATERELWTAQVGQQVGAG